MSHKCRLRSYKSIGEDGKWAADRIEQLEVENEKLSLYKNLADEYGLSVFADLAELQKQRDELEDKLTQSGLVSQLTDAWCRENNSQIPWGKLIEMVSVLENITNEERDRLLCLDYPDYPELVGKLTTELDELLAALEQIASGEADNRSILSGGECQRIAYDAIATAKGTTP